ncbi:Protein-L-isoaspartate O-methyltransferase [Roseibacterium elongatum DSM 19469]|uniref:Protein-L-isoaspartate O-methyltransferase n=1 Tax=Roseicyclus elongatus DSM 19469 TaxID=1294273 RepID=W8SJB0_9RHOB|nr:protein-L-isoaspartate O-methyltransferase [Roseibacterium elongatum]AHM02585.1 Protein-L-isoaspartate O-methyltransferase [Roseibacterium elongatum DSM 19469]
MADFASRRVTMVDTQVRPSDVTKFTIIDAMLSIPREEFVPDAKRDLAYVGGPIELAPHRQLLDARTTAKMLDALDLDPTDVVLEIGSGLGYITALLSRMVEAVVAVEEDGELAEEAEANLATQGVLNAAVVTGPLAEGAAKHGPFDAIVISGGIEEMPAGIIEQLKPGGQIIAIFMKGALGEVCIGFKSPEGRVSWRMEFNATAEVLPGFAKAQSFVF